MSNRIGIFLFVKNEVDFIEKWLRHNLQIADEITIIDNGSTDGTLDVLMGFRDRIRLVEDHSRFGQKGRVCLKWMITSDADLLVPLDADELLVLDDGIQVSGDPIKTREYLQKITVKKNDRFQVRRTFTKNPECPGWWGVSKSNKRFFSRRGLLGVDCGFHVGRMESNGRPVPSNISHLHYHFRSKDAWLKSTEQKLKARLGKRWNDENLLRSYTGPSFHSAREFLIYKERGVWHNVPKQWFDDLIGS